MFLAGLAGCGSSGGRQDESEPAGKFQVAIVSAKFPPRQQLAQTSNLTLGVKNIGKKTVPALAVTISLAGKLGEDSARPFSIRDPQVGLAIPDRPVWILEEDYPKLVGSSAPGGAETANLKTFDFGPLKPGETTAALWRVTPVKPGSYTVTYRIDAGLTGKAKAVTTDGSPPTGSFHVKITSVPPLTRVNSQGQVVEIQPGGQGGSSSGGQGGGSKQGGSGGGSAQGQSSGAPAEPQNGSSLPPSGSGY